VDLKSALKADDLFISYWLTDRLTVAVGDCRDVHDVSVLPASRIFDLVSAFERLVTEAEYYDSFFSASAGKHRRLGTPSSMAEVLEFLRSLLITPELDERLRRRRYSRLLIFPDGILHALPIHLLLNSQAEGEADDAFGDGIIYAPSATSYAYCCRRRGGAAPQRAVVAVGDENDDALRWEAGEAARNMPCPATVTSSEDELRKHMTEADIVYFVSHGWSPDAAWRRDAHTAEDTEWGLLFDGRRLGPRDFFGGRLKLKPGAVVVLSACSQGRLMPGAAHELHGLIRSLFYAGAATVLAARWPILNITALAVFTGTLEQSFGPNKTLASGLSRSLAATASRDDLKALMSGPEASTFFWGPFALFGCGD
jgi:hypothetical protein